MKNVLFDKKELILKQKKEMENNELKDLIFRYLNEDGNKIIMTHDERKKVANMQIEKIKKHAHKSRIKEYILWLNGYLNNGGKIHHFRTYNFSTMIPWFTLDRDFKLELPLYGDNSCNLIIPENVNFEFKESGHIDLYFMKDFKCIGGVEFFNNMLKLK